MAMTEEQRRRVEGSYTGETGGGTSWTPKRYRAPKRIKPPQGFPLRRQDAEPVGGERHVPRGGPRGEI